MNRRCSDRHLGTVQKPALHSVPRRSMKTVPVSSVKGESFAKNLSWYLVWESVAIFKNLEELARGLARVQRHQRRRRATTNAEFRKGGLWTTTPPLAHAGGSCDVSRWKVGKFAPEAKSCEVIRSATESSNRSWNIPQNCTDAHAFSGQTRRNRRYLGRAFQRTLFFRQFSITFFHSFLLMDLWPSDSRFGSRKLAPRLEQVAETHTCAHPMSNASISL